MNDSHFILMTISELYERRMEEGLLFIIIEGKAMHIIDINKSEEKYDVMFTESMIDDPKDYKSITVESDHKALLGKWGSP